MEEVVLQEAGWAPKTSLFWLPQGFEFMEAFYTSTYQCYRKHKRDFLRTAAIDPPHESPARARQKKA